jgi:hypothetical protein
MKKKSAIIYSVVILLVMHLGGHRIALSSASTCDVSKITHKYKTIYGDNHNWKQADNSLSIQDKRCIFSHIAGMKGGITKNEILNIFDQQYHLIHDSVPAPASDFGFASIYEKIYFENGVTKKRFFKLSFSFDNNGELNIINPVEIFVDDSDIKFIEYVGNKSVIRNGECLSCHKECQKISNNIYYLCLKYE